MWRFSYRFLKACLLSPVLLCIECKSFHSVLLLQQKIKCHQMAWVDTFKDLDGSFGSRNVILACLVSLAFSKMCPRYQSYTTTVTLPKLFLSSTFWIVSQTFLIMASVLAENRFASTLILLNGLKALRLCGEYVSIPKI